MPPSSDPTPEPAGRRHGGSYAASGVDYDLLDLFKRECQAAAAGTRGALAAHGLAEPEGIRGESAYLIETADAYLAHVEEGLGTKNLVADAMLHLTGVSHYRAIGIDLVATIVNDLVTCGALPVLLAMHAAVGDAAWFAHPGRRADLAAGFAEGCRIAGAVWGGGETPALRGIVEPEGIVLAGSGIGRIAPKDQRIAGDVAPGDRIVLFASSGIHANGVTLARTIADRLPQGYLTPIGDGRSLGEALLVPTVIYSGLLAGCQAAGVRPHYAVHVSGHGWRKLMRLPGDLHYRITDPGEPGALMRFLADAAPLLPDEAYGTFNMGAGFALMLAPADVEPVLALAAARGYRAWDAGVVEAGPRAVTIEPLGLRYGAETLAVR